MDAAELGFNAWIFIGNVLNAQLRGPLPLPNSADRDNLRRLDTFLSPVPPHRMLDAIRSLGDCERSLLLEACNAAQMAAGTEAETTLGLDHQNAEPVMAFLHTPHPTPA